MKATGILLLLLVWHNSFSQWTDFFDDGNFNLAPSWSGSTANFSIENGVLRLTAPAVSGSSYLSTRSDAINEAVWQFSCQLDFNPSSSNYAEVYLVSDSEDLSQDLNGYYVKLGSASDDISLYKQIGSLRTLLISGQDGRLSNSSNTFDVKVTRSNGGEFSLFSRIDGESDWFLEGNEVDDNIEGSEFFGVKCSYTSTRSSKFYFDNFIVLGEAYQDRDAPAVDTIYTVSNTEIRILFNEEIRAGKLEEVRLEINGTNLYSTSQIDQNMILISSAPNLDISNTLLISGFTDLAGNLMTKVEVPFIHYTNEPIIYGDIVINELMIDPSPPEDLPEFEYIELINASSKAIYMTNWSLSDKVSNISIPDHGLLPNEILVLCPREATSLFKGKNILGLDRWVSLNNSSDSISLHNENNILIDLIAYDDSWYADETKSSGGWSLERIDPRHPCSGPLNWQAAVDVRGGTPGEMNSVYFETNDNDFPIIKNVSPLTEDSILIMFNEPILEETIEVSIEDVSISSSEYWKYQRDQIILTTSTLTPSRPYLILCKNLVDCFGNTNPEDSVVIVLTEQAKKADVIISEILFNPVSGGSDFIELYNQSAKYIDLNKMSVSNEKTTKVIDFKEILEPNTYLVLTADTLSLSTEYPMARTENSREQMLPLFNNDKGTAVLKNTNGNTIDSIRYEESWHYSYLTTFDGVSLERVSPNQSGLNSSNWVSGASQDNFATPGYANWLKVEATGTELVVSPQIIVPDADGQDDYSLISLDLGNTDALVSICVYNLQGQIIKELAKNNLTNRLFQVSWDGTDLQGAIVPLGHYVIIANTVYDNGTTRSYRQKLVVGTGF